MGGAGASKDGGGGGPDRRVPVLVVEDHRLFRRSVVRIVPACTFRVVEAESLAAALDLLESQRFFVAIIDWKLRRRTARGKVVDEASEAGDDGAEAKDDEVEDGDLAGAVVDDGFDLLAPFFAKNPTGVAAIISGYDGLDVRDRARRADARFIPKGGDFRADLIQLLVLAASAYDVYDRRLLAKLQEFNRRYESKPPRARILGAALSGRPSSKIAAMTGIKANTVKTNVRAVGRATGLGPLRNVIASIRKGNWPKPDPARRKSKKRPKKRGGGPAGSVPPASAP